MRIRPRREWWSLPLALKWPCSLLMLAVSRATCTSGEPVSPSACLIVVNDLGFFLNAQCHGEDFPLSEQAGRIRVKSRPDRACLQTGCREATVACGLQSPSSGLMTKRRGATRPSSLTSPIPINRPVVITVPAPCRISAPPGTYRLTMQPVISAVLRPTASAASASRPQSAGSRKRSRLRRPPSRVRLLPASSRLIGLVQSERPGLGAAQFRHMRAAAERAAQIFDQRANVSALAAVQPHRRNRCRLRTGQQFQGVE